MSQPLSLIMLPRQISASILIHAIEVMGKLLKYLTK